MEYALIVNTADCIGCHACEIACKQDHNLHVGPRFIRVSPSIISVIEGKPQLRYAVTYCVHCSHPACLDICATRAITRSDEGIVSIIKEACIGCGDCIQACPLGAIELNEKKGIAQKCDLCIERLERGLQPACVASCPSHCVYFGTVTEVNTKLKDNSLLTLYKSV